MEGLGDGGLEALVSVGDHQLEAIVPQQAGRSAREATGVGRRRRAGQGGRACRRTRFRTSRLRRGRCRGPGPGAGLSRRQSLICRTKSRFRQRKPGCRCNSGAERSKPRCRPCRRSPGRPPEISAPSWSWSARKGCPPGSNATFRRRGMPRSAADDGSRCGRVRTPRSESRGAGGLDQMRPALCVGAEAFRKVGQVAWQILHERIGHDVFRQWSSFVRGTVPPHASTAKTPPTSGFWRAGIWRFKRLWSWLSARNARVTR